MADGATTTIDIPAGLEVYGRMRRRQIEQYLARLKWATIDRAATLNPEPQAELQEPQDASNRG